MSFTKYLQAFALVAALLAPMAQAQTRTIKFAFQNQKEHPQAIGAQNSPTWLPKKALGI